MIPWGGTPRDFFNIKISPMKLKESTITKIFQRREGVRNISQRAGVTPQTVYNWINANKVDGPLTTIKMANTLRWLLDVDNALELYDRE